MHVHRHIQSPLSTKQSGEPLSALFLHQEQGHDYKLAAECDTLQVSARFKS